jgi:peptidyl-prolyl cis-trans isomerase C
MHGKLNPEQLQSMKETIREQAVDSIVNRTLLLQAVEREGIKVSQEKIEANVDQIKNKFDSEEAFIEQLKGNGMTLKDVVEEVEKGVKLEALIEKQTANVKKATDKDIEEFYNSNVERFKQPERVRASHVLVKTGAEDSEQAKREKRQKIEKILTDISQGGDFSTMASQYSDCPSKARGGDLGFFSRGQMVKPFEETAFALNVGEISGVVETQFGYHIIQVNEREEARTIPLDEIRDDIAAHLDEMNRQKEIRNYISELRDEAKIEYPDSDPMMKE